jgi:hypothetical protein
LVTDTAGARCCNFLLNGPRSTAIALVVAPRAGTRGDNSSVLVADQLAWLTTRRQ